MRAIKEYQAASIESVINVASPHKITSMLYEGILKNLYLAKHAQKMNDFEKRSEAVSKAEAIVITLASTLNDEAAPELSQNLRRLYDFVITSLNDFIMDGDTAKVDGCVKVIKEIKAGWDSIEVE